jgi:hypothetical protein
MITDLFLRSDRFTDEYPAFIVLEINRSSIQCINLFTAVAIFEINGESQLKCIENMKITSGYEESCREWFKVSPFKPIKVSIRGVESTDKFENMLKIVEHSLHRSSDHTISQSTASFTDWDIVDNKDFTFRTDFIDERLDTLPKVSWMYISSVRFGESVHKFIPYILHSFMKFDEVNTGDNKLICDYVVNSTMDDATYRVFETICELVDDFHSTVTKLDGYADFLEYLYFSETFLNPIIYHYRPHIIKAIFKHPLIYNASMYECRACLHPYGLTFAIIRMLTTLDDDDDTFEEYWIEFNTLHDEHVPPYCTNKMLRQNPDILKCIAIISDLERTDNQWALAMLSRIRIIRRYEKYDLETIAKVWKYMYVDTTMFNAICTDDLLQYIMSMSKHFPFRLNSRNAFRLFGIYIRGKEAIGISIPRLLHGSRTDFYLRIVMLYSGCIDKLCDTDTESLRLYIEYGIFNGYIIPPFLSFFVYVVNAITPGEQRDIHWEHHDSDYFYAWVMCCNIGVFSEIDMIGLLHFRRWRDSGPITYLLNYADNLSIYKLNLLTLREELPEPEMYEDRLILDTFHPILKTEIFKDDYLKILR